MVSEYIFSSLKKVVYFLTDIFNSFTTKNQTTKFLLQGFKKR